jgi:hypothetical protein
MKDELTVCRSYGRRLAKLIRADGTIEAYDEARTYDLLSRQVHGLSTLANELATLQRQPHCAVVRGAIADPARVTRVRRLVHPDPKAGDAPTLRDVPRLWLALDVDGVQRRPDIDPADLAACGRAVGPSRPADRGRRLQRASELSRAGRA